MNSFDWKKTREKVCGFCEEKAISACNFESFTFTGCRRPFCFNHGLSHSTEVVLENRRYVAVDEDEEKAFVANLMGVKGHGAYFRCCDECREPFFEKRQRCFMITKLFLAIAFLFILIATAMAFYLSQTVLKMCTEDTLELLSTGGCLKKNQNFTVLEYQNLVRYRTPHVHKDDFLIMSGMGSKLINKDQLASELDVDEWHMFAFCYYQQGGMWIFVGDAIDIEEPCYTAPCEANGKQELNLDGDCITVIPARFKESGCPAGAEFSEFLQACTKIECPEGKYRIDFEKSRCVNCPYYTRASYYQTECDSVIPWRHKWPTPGQDFYLNDPQSVYSGKKCSGKPSSLTPVQADALENLGYIPRQIDPFGYWGCPFFPMDPEFLQRPSKPNFIEKVQDPKTGLPSTSRQCLLEEMNMQRTLNCTSICKPCEEKFDFAKKKCVPASDYCRYFNETLTTIGECQNPNESNKRKQLESYGIFFCANSSELVGHPEYGTLTGGKMIETSHGSIYYHK